MASGVLLNTRLWLGATLAAVVAVTATGALGGSGGGTITTIAGNGNTGDGGPATSAQVSPWGVAVDGQRNVYIVDSDNESVRRVSAGGTITTIAGTGNQGFSGDGGPATSAELDSPTGVAVDRQGNVYIVDRDNNRVRKVGPGGTITTFAGGGSSLGDGGPATSAQLNYPYAVAVDGQRNVYIADGRRVRKVSASGTITTFAGGGSSLGDGGPATSARLRNATGVAVDGQRNIYIADGQDYRVRKVSRSGTITTFAGTGKAGFTGDGGPATSAQLDAYGVAVDGQGNVYIAGSESHRVRKVGPGGTIRTFAGTGKAGSSGGGGPAVAAQLNFPYGVAADAHGNVYIADYGNRRVRKVGPGGTITTFAGTDNEGFSGDGGKATSARLTPNGVAVDGQGNVYIADYTTRTSRVRKVSRSGTITTFAGTGKPGFSVDGGPATSAQLRTPDGVAVDGKGNVYIADSEDQRVRKVSPGGTITTIAGTGEWGFSGDGGPATSARLYNPYGVAVDRKGNVYIADSEDQRVRKVSRSGTITTFAGTGKPGFSGDGGPATSAKLSWPHGVAVDGKGNVYIADRRRVRKVSASGTITTFAGGGSSLGDGGPATSARLSPAGVAVDRKGNVYIADNGNNRVRRVSPGGTITTFAGTGKEGFSGDGGPATSARLYLPAGVAVDRKGNVYIADKYNYRVRKVTVGAQASALTVTLGGASPQQLLAQKGITVTAKCNNPCSLVASGSVTILGTKYVFGLSRATAKLAAGKRTLVLHCPAAEQRRFRKLFKPGQRARAVITVKATDKAGNTTKSKRTVAVRA